MDNRREGLKGIHGRPMHGVVERADDRFTWGRRLVKADECFTQTSATMIRVAMIPLRIRRLAWTIPA